MIDWNRLLDDLYPWRGTMPTLTLRGAARQRGRQYGEACASLIESVSGSFVRGLVQATGVPQDELYEKAFRYERRVRELIGNEYVLEMQAIATAAQISYEDVLVLNCGWDLLNSLPTPEEHPDYMCSALAAWGTSTTTGQVVCGHNDDGSRFIDQYLVLLSVETENATTVGPMVPGYVGYHRMWNDHGVVLLGLALEDGCLNNEFEYNIPMWLLMRWLAERAMTAEDAVQLLSEFPPATAFNFLFLDRTGAGQIVEATACHSAVIKSVAGQDDLVLTNHALDKGIARYLRMRPHPSSTDYRYETVSRLLSEHRGSLDLTHIREILSSHYDARLNRNRPSLDSPCRHGETIGKLTGTVSTVAVEIGSDEIYSFVSLGNPCENRWLESSLTLR